MSRLQFARTIVMVAVGWALSPTVTVAQESSSSAMQEPQRKMEGSSEGAVGQIIVTRAQQYQSEVSVTGESVPIPENFSLRGSPPETPSPQVGETAGITLSELTFLAQTTNAALREASAKVAAAQGEAIQVGLPPNPFYFVSSPQWAGNVSQYNIVYGQDVVTAGKLRLNRAAAMRTVEQAQLDFARIRFEVLTNVRRQFYLAAAAQRRAEVLNDLVQVSQRTRDVGSKLLKAGESNIGDATLLDIELHKAEMTSRNNAAVLAAARKQLAAAVGLPEMEIGLLQYRLEDPLPAYEAEAVRRGVVDRNAIAAAAAVEIQKTQLQLQRAQAEPWPNFQLQGGYQNSVGGDQHRLQNQGYAQFTSSLPVWNRNQGGIQAAQAETVRATAAFQRVGNDLSRQTAVAFGEYVAAEQRVEIYQTNLLPKSREVFRINQSLFEQGQSDFLRLLQAQRTLIEIDLGYVDAQEARWTAAATIAGLLQFEQFP